MKRKEVAKIIILAVAIATIVFGILILTGVIQINKNKDSLKEMNTDAIEANEVITDDVHTDDTSEEILYEKDGIVVYYSGVDENNISLSVSNNYGKDIMFGNEQVAINGVMIDTVTSQEIKNGEKADINISWKEFAPNISFSEVKNIKFNLTFADDRGLEETYFAIIDCGDKTFKEHVEHPKTEILNKNHIKAYFIEMTEGEELYPTEAKVLVTNDSENIIRLDVYEGVVNGKDAGCFGTIVVYPGCKAIGKIGIDEYQPDEIKSAIFNVTVNDSEYNEIIKPTNSSEIKLK